LPWSLAVVLPSTPAVRNASSLVGEGIVVRRSPNQVEDRNGGTSDEGETAIGEAADGTEGKDEGRNEGQDPA
jgi:hypothetical protein